MKTIFDAVNALKGVWPSDSIQIIEIDGVEFSEKEFNAQVKECANNFGLPSVTAKPVYTQERFDNGQLPSVGMKCFYDFMDCTGWISCIFCGECDGVVWLLCGGKNEHLRRADVKFRPIDIRTPKEKAIDDLIKDDFPCGVLIDRKLLGVAYDKWVK